MFVYLSISIYYETMNEINHSHIIIGVGVLVIVLFRRIEKARSKICRTANDLCPHSIGARRYVLFDPHHGGKR
jgi:ABC-type spermidine/putrescine transport system permease subunit II